MSKVNRTGRTRLFGDIRRAYRLAMERSKPPSEQTAPTSRRAFLQGSAAAALSVYTGGLASAMGKFSPYRVVVVGGGIAGLNATYLLQQAGFHVHLFESSTRVGGRIKTAYGQVAHSLYTELGGEFVDTSHEDMMALAQSFGLGLLDTGAPSEDDLKIAYYANGKMRSEDEVIEAFMPLAAKVSADSDNLSDDITYKSHSPFDARLDRTSLREYLDKNEMVDWLYKVLEAAYVNEYGLELDHQSSLNFIETIGTDTEDGFAVYGESDQRYKIKGGNQQITDNLAQRVASKTSLGHRLEAIHRRANGEYALTFQTSGGGVREVPADIVVLCLPFSILRDVQIRVRMPDSKVKAIQQLGYGQSAKLILGFHGQPWRDLGFTGDAYVDRPFQSGWDSGRLQGSSIGSYTIYPGGKSALALGHGTAESQAARLLPGLDQVFPGVIANATHKSILAYWPSNPNIKAGYAGYLPGQWTGIRGAEKETVGGTMFFAGEHTSLDWQGYMNGGAESGRFAAEAIIRRFK